MEEVKIHLQRDLMNFKVTYDDIKSGKKAKLDTVFREHIF